MSQPNETALYLSPTAQKNQYLKVFLLALLTATLFFLPSVLYYGGHFYFSGDFNVQQIPFYQEAHRAVRSGDIFWSWTTDLGSNFIASYSFYLLGSPFFWLTLPFPTAWLPYMMAPLLVLKTACAALTGYAFIKRFCRNQDYAAIGGLLYAFSGFATYNIFFNHFHEPIVFFPLMLIALEELVLKNRRGVFALAVAINAIISYFFFAGQVVFVVIYFFLRFTDKNWRMTLTRFLSVALEAVLGVLLAAFMLLPSALTVMANPRTDNFATGFSALLYDRIQRYPYILQSMFFPPELPARLNFFPDAGSRWASVAAWLPFVSMSGVIAYVQCRKKSWIKRILYTCLVMAFIPVLNSLFYALNASYYARWFYMPVLIMALATAKSLSEPGIDIKRGMRWTLVVTLAFTIGIGLMPKKVDGQLQLGLYDNTERFWGYVVIALYCIVMFWLIHRYYHGKPAYPKLLTVGVCMTTVIYTVFFLLSGSIYQTEATFISSTMDSSAEEMGLPTDYFWRMDVDGDTMDNQGMFWDIPNIQTFHSVVPASIMEFYPMVGVTRDVGSRPEQSQYALRGLLSVKYLFIAEADATRENDPVACTMPGFAYWKTENQFQIYENQAFVPMGFCFDKYLTTEQFEEMTANQRCRAVLKALVLDEEQAQKYAGLLEPVQNINDLDLTQATYLSDCDALRGQSCSSFTRDNHGFTAGITLERDELVFFSVPYESGWTATVNGQPAEVEKVTVGFMAVRAGAGENVIRFHYETPGLRVGLYAGIFAVVVLIVYVLLCTLYQRRHPTPPRPFSFEDGLDALPAGAQATAVAEIGAHTADASAEDESAAASPQGFTLVRNPEDAPQATQETPAEPETAAKNSPEPHAAEPAADTPSEAPAEPERPKQPEQQPPEQEK